MAITAELCGGEKDFNLIYDSTEDVIKAALKSSRMNESVPRTVWHQGVGMDGNELVEVTHEDGRWPWILTLDGSTWPELNREMAAFRRTCRQAEFHAKGANWADEVYLKCRPHGDASLTYFMVKLVEDLTGGYLSGGQVPEVRFDQAAFTFTVDGNGYGDEEALNNALRNGHMLLEDGETSGLAYGLTKEGAPTVTLDTDTYLIGGQSQKIVTDDSNTQGIKSATVTLGAGNYAKGYAWLTDPSGDSTVYVFLVDGSGTPIDSIQATSANAEKFIVYKGTTWRQYVVSGQNSNANVYLWIVRSDPLSATTWYVDGLYLETSTTATPSTRKAWADYPTVCGSNMAGENLVPNGTMTYDDGWSNYGSPTTNERSDVQKYAGAYSRKFTVDAANEGIQSDYFLTLTGGLYYATVYVYPDDGTRCRIKVRNGDDSGWVYDAAHTGLNQDAWNEITFNFTETAGGNGAYIVIESDTDNAGSWYVDEVEIIAPSDHRDYIDVWGIPGDRPAWMYLTISPPAAAIGYINSLYLVNYLAEQSGAHIYDIGVESGVADSVDGACEGGDYQEEVLDGYFDLTDLSQERGKYLILARVRTDDEADPTIQISYSAGSAEYIDLEEVVLDTIDRWLLVTLGIIDMEPSQLFVDEDGFIHVIIYSAGTNSQLVDFDWLRFLPYKHFMIINPNTTDIASNGWLKIDGRKKAVVAKGNAGVYREDVHNLLGGLWSLEPGVMNRLTLVAKHSHTNNSSGESDTCRIDYVMDVALSYRPRTRGFLA